MREHSAERTRATSGEPELPMPELLRRSIDDVELRRGLRVSLAIDGGLTGEKYQFELRVSGEGKAEIQMVCGLTHRAVSPCVYKLNPVLQRELLQELLESQVLSERHEPPGFPPDSLVGRLELAYERAVFRVFFMADPEQARTAGRLPNAALVRAVEAMFALGALMVGRDNLRP